MALAIEAGGLLWVGWSPEVIAASCRASLLPGVPVVADLPLAQLIWDSVNIVARPQGQGGGALKVVLQEPVAGPLSDLPKTDGPRVIPQSHSLKSYGPRAAIHLNQLQNS